MQSVARLKGSEKIDEGDVLEIAGVSCYMYMYMNMCTCTYECMHTPLVCVIHVLEQQIKGSSVPNVCGTLPIVHYVILSGPGNTRVVALGGP